MWSGEWREGTNFNFQLTDRTDKRWTGVLQNIQQTKIFQWWIGGRESQFSYSDAERAGDLASKKANEAHVATKSIQYELPEMVKNAVTGIECFRVILTLDRCRRNRKVSVYRINIQLVQESH